MTPPVSRWIERVRARWSREGLLWRLLAALVLTIYSSAYFVVVPMEWLRDHGFLRATIIAAFGVCLALLVPIVVQARPRLLEIPLYLVALALYVLMIRHLDILQERFHLIEYGAVAGLAWGALRARWGPGSGWRQPALGALLVTTAAGWGDELVQAILPNRHYDLRDVLTNAIAGALLLLVLEGRARLRAERPATAPASSP